MPKLINAHWQIFNKTEDLLEFRLGKDDSGLEKAGDPTRFSRAGKCKSNSGNCDSVDACWCPTLSNSAFKFLTGLLELLGKSRLKINPLQTAWILLAAFWVMVDWWSKLKYGVKTPVESGVFIVVWVLSDTLFSLY